eukprot:TRINITY_DN63301_c0_g1_i1.p1 TRINITY_DN63301_c0_g1~~TRINITY_DN63301_c0_g1_i1.p1  ORF type:complete len:391 (-),score=43.19 TRINITY_DN63301_c0_g1_i1:122-1294(-)
MFRARSFGFAANQSAMVSLEAVARDAFIGNASKLGIIGVAWLVQRGNDETTQGVHGATSADDDGVSLRPSDLWHWGSCAKALSATVVASLVDSGAFTFGWETTVSHVLPDVCSFERDGSASIGAVTLRQLATHRGGVCTDLDEAIEEALANEHGELPAIDQRAAYMRKLAFEPLACTPGFQFGYSNAGFVALSVMAEVAAQKPWEQLVLELVVQPLGMQSFGFGAPPVRTGSVRGHNEAGEVEDHADAAWHHASFSVHSTLADWAIFASAHQRVLAGETGALSVVGLSPETASTLHCPVSPAVVGEAFDGPHEPMSMAMGWETRWTDNGPERQAAAISGVLYHWGTNFRFNAGAYVRASPPLLILAASNSGSSLARLCHRLAIEAITEAT